MFVPILIPNAETQVMFNESTKNSNTITYDSFYTERKSYTDGNELQVDIGSGQNINSPKNLIVSFQTLDRIGAHNKKIKLSQFSIMSMLKNIFVKHMVIDIQRMLFSQTFPKMII